ncbi:MAG: DUF2007 domain-containing protein [Cyclobacteriaceae bacterium]
MEAEDKIIVIKTFDTPAMAGLAKSKLDAFDIPCFLTEENMGSLYPFTRAGFSGIRLHVFDKDVERAKKVLEEDNMKDFSNQI